MRVSGNMKRHIKTVADSEQDAVLHKIRTAGRQRKGVVQRMIDSDEEKGTTVRMAVTLPHVAFLDKPIEEE